MYDLDLKSNITPVEFYPHTKNEGHCIAIWSNVSNRIARKHTRKDRQTDGRYQIHHRPDLLKVCSR